MFKGWKTLLFSAAVALVGVAQTFDWTTVVTSQNAGLVLTAVGIIGAGLRFVTNSAVGSK